MLLFVSLLLLLPPGLQDEADFEDDHARIHRMMELGRWDKAQDALNELLREHEGAPYALAQQPELVGDVKRCAFYGAYEAGSGHPRRGRAARLRSDSSSTT